MSTHRLGERRPLRLPPAAPRDSSGPIPIAQLLPVLRERVRTIPVRVWRDGAWQIQWVVVSYRSVVFKDAPTPHPAVPQPNEQEH